MDYYQSVEVLWNRSKSSYEQLVRVTADLTEVPYDIVRHSYKRMLVESFKGGKKSFLRHTCVTQKLRVKIGLFCYIIISFLLGSTGITKNGKGLHRYGFDLWNNSAFDKFYSNIVKRLANENYVFYKTGKKIGFPKSYHRITSDYRSFFLSKKSVFHLIVLLSRYLYLSSKIDKTNGKIDINLLFILMLIKYFQYSEESKRINSKIFVSAADNNFSGLRYFLYKKGVVDFIVLIQNGFRTGGLTGDGGDLYSYCDLYFGFSESQFKLQKGMVCAKFFAVGSVALASRYISFSLKAPSQNPFFRNDCIFIESVGSKDSSYFRRDDYEKAVNLVCKLAKNNTHLTVKYRTNGKIKKKSRQAWFDNLYTKITNAGVIIDYAEQSNTYEEIMDSRLVVFYRTTLGYESLVLGSYVLNINPSSDSLPFSSEDEPAVLLGHDYRVFETKVYGLLHARRTGSYDNYFGVMRKKFLNQELDNTHKIFEKIIYEIENLKVSGI